MVMSWRVTTLLQRELVYKEKERKVVEDLDVVQKKSKEEKAEYEKKKKKLEDEHAKKLKELKTRCVDYEK